MTAALSRIRARVGGIRADERQRQRQALGPDAADPCHQAERDRRQRPARLGVVVGRGAAAPPGPLEAGHVDRHRAIPAVGVRLPAALPCHGRRPAREQPPALQHPHGVQQPQVRPGRVRDHQVTQQRQYPIDCSGIGRLLW